MARIDPFHQTSNSEVDDDPNVELDVEDVDDAHLNPPNLLDALLQRALDAGTQHVQNKVRAAAGKLAPITFTLSGLVNDAPIPGVIELLVSVAGSRPTVVKVPYAASGTQVPPQHHHRMLQLVGRTVRLRIEIDR